MPPASRKTDFFEWRSRLCALSLFWGRRIESILKRRRLREGGRMRLIKFAIKFPPPLPQFPPDEYEKGERGDGER